MTIIWIVRPLGRIMFQTCPLPGVLTTLASHASDVCGCKGCSDERTLNRVWNARNQDCGRNCDECSGCACYVPPSCDRVSVEEIGYT